VAWREWWLRTTKREVREEEKAESRGMAGAEAETAHSEAITEKPVPEQSCVHPAELQKEIAGVGRRCGQCGGVLTRQNQAIGVSRKDFETPSSEVP
jgi:hypothetical protein